MTEILVLSRRELESFLRFEDYVEAVHAQLGDLVAGRRLGRTRPDEVIIFDGTGSGIQDVAAATRAYEVARAREAGSWLELA